MQAQSFRFTGEALQGEKDFQLDALLQMPTDEITMSAARPAVIVCPGGAYAFRAQREATPVALRFAAQGFQTFVLQYSVAPARFPRALSELAAAISWIRANQRHLQVDPARILLCGFSAGGHLAASLAVHFNADWLREEVVRSAWRLQGRGEDEAWLPLPEEPDFSVAGTILGYPVVCMERHTHAESRANLLGPDPDALALQRCSVASQVHADVAPCFVWHTAKDQVVAVENSLLLVRQLSAARVPFEFHVFPRGVHGLSLASACSAERKEQIEPAAAVWFDLLKTWWEGLFEGL